MSVDEPTIEYDDGPPSLASSSEDEGEDEEAYSEDDDHPQIAPSGEHGQHILSTLMSYHAYNRCDVEGSRHKIAFSISVRSGTSSGFVPASFGGGMPQRLPFTAEDLYLARIFLRGEHGPHFSLSSEGSTERVGGNTCELEEVD